MDKVQLYGGLLVVALTALSVIMHKIGQNKIAAIDDKVLAILNQLGVKPPQS